MRWSEVSPPEQRVTLKVLIDRSRGLIEGLREADLDTKRRIYSGYPNLRHLEYEAKEPMGNLKLFRRDIAHLERLCHALEEALSRVPEGGGSPGIAIARFAAVKFAEVYERFTGEKYRFSEKRGRDAPARFVKCALSTIAPKLTDAKIRKLTDAKIRTALRHAVKVLNRRRRNQKPPPKTG